MNEILVVLSTGGLAAVVAAWGVVTQRAIARRRATLDYIFRGEADADLIQARKKFIELAKKPETLAPWAAEVHEKSDEVQSIRLVLNEFEIYSIGIQRGIIDAEIYKRWCRSTVVLYWKRAEPFVSALRLRLDNKAIFHEFQELAGWFEKGTMPKRNWWWGRFF